ncbi:acyl carrier protein [Desulfitobacterium dichloroeliminans LMG P-21439]|uniref:Acyl carrier protein n=1 Tax=Desulfitobacterium dichloroeliminans (strain LMG P-21439 / DCA1) TaxID=871963 RepID=L0F2H0_DESDL|nr:acyl carrier protein [Desulfitobacterium dichloroeliminans]AGA68019.1 acyl carrier protein [Desulfitobacterium dichloroeliminans LMG P-21439]
MAFQKIASILAEIIGIDDEDITPDTELNREYGIKPVDLAKLIIECERTFQITIHDEDVYRFRYVHDLMEYIRRIKEEE